MSRQASLTLTSFGSALIFATRAFLVLTRPTDWDHLAGPAVTTLLGYGAGTLLILIACLPQLNGRVLALIPVALVLNMVIGQIVGSIALPVYLDTLGTVLVAALVGPKAGLATGALSSVVWGLFNPLAIPFVAGSALTGWLAGWVFQQKWAKNLLAIVASGLVVGLVTGAIAAPVAAFVYGGTAGVGTGAVVLLFQEMGQSLFGAVTTQAFLSDPLDKIIVFLAVALVLRALPQRIRGQFVSTNES